MRGIAAVVADALPSIGRAPASAGPRRLAPLRARPAALGVSVGEQQSHYCDTEQNKTDRAHVCSPCPSHSLRQLCERAHRSLARLGIAVRRRCPHGARTPASTSTAAQWARRIPSGCGQRQRGRPAHHSRPRSIRQTGGLRSRALGSVGSRREIKLGIVEQRQLDLLTETAKSASARSFAAPRKRTNGPTSWDVRFVPKPAVSNRSNAAPHSITSSARSMIEAGTTRSWYH